MNDQTIPQPVIEEHVQTILDLTERIEQMTQQRDALKDALRGLADGKYPVGDVTLTISGPMKRFNADLAAEQLPPELLEAIKTLQVHPATAKQVLPPALYAACSAPVGDKRVSIR